MTVCAREAMRSTLVTVADDATVAGSVLVPRLNADLSPHADVPTAAGQRLLANSALAHQGFSLQARGFVLERAEAAQLRVACPDEAHVIRDYRNGRDLASRPREVCVIDFGLMAEEDAKMLPVTFGIVQNRVRPERETNGRASYRKYWWRFGEARAGLRDAAHGLAQLIVTVYVSKHRYFRLLPASIAPDDTLVCIASDSAFLLGVLSSSIHSAWALAAGGRMGVGNDPRYNKSLCFDSFPFPAATPAAIQTISDLALQMHTARDRALARGELVTMTGLYNVMAKVRAGEMLSPKDREIHKLGACDQLIELQSELDSAVAQAYGWSWPEPPALILERLVALHDARVVEESRGLVRWLRPDYQRPRFGSTVNADAEPDMSNAAPGASAPSVVSAVPWPGDAIGQITLLRGMAAVSPLSVDDAVRRLSGSRRDIVHRHLETLALLGEVRTTSDGRYAITAGVL